MNPFSDARRARGLSLRNIANTTRLSLRHVKAIDEGRFADLPVGIYARAYVRAVADVVRLDAAELENILSLLPPAVDPLPVLKEAGERRHPPNGAFEMARVCAAASVDSLLLLVINAAVVVVVGAACGLSVGTLLTTAPGPLAVLCGTTWVLYFVLLAGIQGRTAGQYLCGLPYRHPGAPLNLGEILQRAAGAWDLRGHPSAVSREAPEGAARVSPETAPAIVRREA